MQQNLFSADTNEWHLSGYLKWTPKVDLTRSVRCSCRAWGDDDYCNKCRGTGYYIEKVDIPPEPPMPDGLSAHMRKAWNEFFNIKE